MTGPVRDDNKRESALMITLGIPLQQVEPDIDHIAVQSLEVTVVLLLVD